MNGPFQELISLVSHDEHIQKITTKGVLCRSLLFILFQRR